MKRYAALSAGVLRRAALRGALAAAAVSTLFLVGLLSPGATQGNSAFNVDGSVTKLEIFYHGVCNPGTLQSTIANDQAMPFTINVSGDIFGCLATDDQPASLLIDNELFAYANVATETTVKMSDDQTLPFPLQVLGTSEFPTNGEIYVGSERMTYTGTTPTSFNITSREPPPAQHDIGSFVRLQGRLKLVGRAQPTYSDGDPVVVSGATLAAKHQIGAIASSPLTQLTCRGRLDQTEVPGAPDTVVSRTQCYTRLEPGDPWPDPYTGPLLALAPIFYHNISVGTIGDEDLTSTTTLTLVTGIQDFDCFPLVEDQLWIKVREEITVDKTPMNKDPGTFRISVYTNQECDASPIAVLGEGDSNNVSSIEIPSNTDTDGDGCTDYMELGTQEQTGGKRDPFNQYDFYDLNGDKIITIFDEIIEVANGFGTAGTNPNYSAAKDRGPKVPDTDGIDDQQDAFDGPGPSDWNRSGPDGTITVFDDILVVAGQFGHDCRP